MLSMMGTSIMHTNYTRKLACIRLHTSSQSRIWPPRRFSEMIWNFCEACLMYWIKARSPTGASEARYGYDCPKLLCPVPILYLFIDHALSAFHRLRQHRHTRPRTKKPASGLRRYPGRVGGRGARDAHCASPEANWNTPRCPA